jgi:hypothetical protein
MRVRNTQRLSLFLAELEPLRPQLALSNDSISTLVATARKELIGGPG